MMSIINNIERELKEARDEDIIKAVNDLRELGDKLEECDPHFFEEEKFKKIIERAREVVRKNE